jgi:hypothetical protein
MTQRFQPYGLMKSRCFKESHDTLSCLTCHNPHADASADPATYVSACLRCHPSSASASARASGSATGKPCPVNPRAGCIRCHMPSREVAPDLPVRMADHFITVHREIR